MVLRAAIEHEHLRKLLRFANAKHLISSVRRLIRDLAQEYPLCVCLCGGEIQADRGTKRGGDKEVPHSNKLLTHCRYSLYFTEYKLFPKLALTMHC